MRQITVIYGDCLSRERNPTWATILAIVKGLTCFLAPLGIALAFWIPFRRRKLWARTKERLCQLRSSEGISGNQLIDPAISEIGLMASHTFHGAFTALVRDDLKERYTKERCPRCLHYVRLANHC